jgi:CarD family transcriptional regulator
MLKENMSFQVGDQIIHSAYGLGTIIQIEEKEISGIIARYYVVKLRDLTVWVPISEEGEHSLRFPIAANDFGHILLILAAPGKPLSEDRFERRTQLTDRIKDGTIESICEVVRDLTQYKRTKKINDYDNATLDRAKNFLLREWSFSLSIPILQAEQELKELLDSRNVT